MRKILSLIALFAIALFQGVSCSSGDTAEEKGNGEEQVGKVTVYNAIFVANSNKMIFIALNKNGEASYCFDKYTMGYGKYTITGNQLTIYNEYTGYTDELTIVDTESGIKLRGNIGRLNSTESSYIDMAMDKSEETLTTSVKGEEWQHSGHSKNGDVTAYYSFTTDHECNWETYLDVTGTLVAKGSFAYIARTLIDTDGDGNKRTRKIVYCHSAKSNKPDLYAMDEKNSLDISY